MKLKKIAAKAKGLTVKGYRFGKRVHSQAKDPHAIIALANCLLLIFQAQRDQRETRLRAETTKKRRKSQKLSKFPVQELPKVDPTATEQIFETFVQSVEAILAGMAALNSEMATFCNERPRENVESSESLLGYRVAEEAFKIQWDFCRRAAEQYLNQTRDLLGILAKCPARKLLSDFSWL